MKKMTLSPPWCTFLNELKALFERDPDILVGELEEQEDGPANFMINIEVKKHEKYLALDRLIPKAYEFGNITVGIMLYDEENANEEDDRIALYKTLFHGNPIVQEIQEVTDFTGTRHGFVCFKPEVVQFFNDNLNDLNGNWNGLAQDIAREVFADEIFGIHFCTAKK